MTYLSQLMGAPTPENPMLSQSVHYLTLRSHAGSKSSTGPGSDFTRSLWQTKSKLGRNFEIPLRVAIKVAPQHPEKWLMGPSGETASTNYCDNCN